MEKIKIGNEAVFLTPMPMVLVGAVVDGKVNFLAVAWAARVNFKPAMFAVALGSHHTNKGIDEHREFSINISRIFPCLKKPTTASWSQTTKPINRNCSISFMELSPMPP